MKTMKCILVLCVAAVSCCTAFGQQATKAAAASKTAATVIPANDGKWHTVLTTTIKNPTADDDFFIDVSQVNRITTTNTSSSAAPGVISTGDARLMLRVLVDGIVALPGPVVWDEQLTALTSNLQKFLALSCTQTTVPNVVVTTSCVCTGKPDMASGAVSCAPPPAPLPPGTTTRTCTTTSNPDPDVVTTCTILSGSDEALATLLSETISHSFDFLAVGVGGMGDTHIVQVQEMLVQTTTSGGTAIATIGPQTLKVVAVDLKPAQ